MSGLRPPRVFYLQRKTDLTGISGTGVVAWGVQFPDGVVALRWTSRTPTSVVFHDAGIESVRAVHGHGGDTEIVFLDGGVELQDADEDVVEAEVIHGEVDQALEPKAHSRKEELEGMLFQGFNEGRPKRGV